MKGTVAEPKRVSRMKPWLLVSAAALLLATGCGNSLPSEPFSPPALKPLPHSASDFVVVGDFGTDNDAEYMVADAIETWTKKHAPRAFVSTGDNAYPEAELNLLEAAWKPYRWVDDRNIDVVVALGNHDLEDGSSTIAEDFFRLKGSWYTKRFGPVEFFVLDTNADSGAEQFDWLAGRLQASDARWKIAVQHKPPFNCGRSPIEDPAPAWLPLYERYGVDLVLSGHEHNYQRFLVGQTTFVVTGGGGDSLYDLEDCTSEQPPETTDDANYHFVWLETSGNKLRLTAIAASGRIIDQAELD